MVSEGVRLPGDKKPWDRAGRVLNGYQVSGPRPPGRPAVRPSAPTRRSPGQRLRSRPGGLSPHLPRGDAVRAPHPEDRHRFHP